MRDSKLVDILSRFTVQELKDFKKLVDSPWFNNQIPVRKLLEYLLPFAPDFASPKLTYNHCFQYIFEARKVKSDPQVAVSKVMTKLINLLKEFAIQRVVETEELFRIQAQIRFFRERSLVELIPRLLEEADENIEEFPYRNENYFRQKLLIEFERSSYLNAIQDKHLPDYNLNMQNKALDAYYAASKLQTYCFAYNETKRINYSFNFEQLDQFLQWLRQSGMLLDFGIDIWYKALMLLHEPTPEHYLNFKEVLDAHNEHFDPAQLRVFYSYLANKAQAVFNDRYAYYKALFDLYQKQIALGTIYLNGYLSPMLLRNITIVGIKLGEFEWVEDFLEKNAERIVPSYKEREDTVVLCKAYLLFAKGEFQSTLDMINALRYDSLYTKMDERRLRLMCYFEMGIESPMEDLINSFRKFLTDHKKRIPAEYLEANRQFIHFVHKLSTVNLKNREAQVKLLEEIQQVAVLPEKEWILSKGKELSIGK